MPRQHFLRNQSLHQNNLEKSLTKTISLRHVASLTFLYTQLNSSWSNLAYSNLTSTKKINSSRSSALIWIYWSLPQLKFWNYPQLPHSKATFDLLIPLPLKSFGFHLNRDLSIHFFQKVNKLHYQLHSMGACKSYASYMILISSLT